MTKPIIKRTKGINKRLLYTMYKKGKTIIQSIRPDIYVCTNNNSNNKAKTTIGQQIMNLPSHLLSKEINDLCCNIILGIEPIYPPGYKLYDPLTSLPSTSTLTTDQNNDKTNKITNNQVQVPSMTQSTTSVNNTRTTLDHSLINKFLCRLINRNKSAVEKKFCPEANV